MDLNEIEKLFTYHDPKNIDPNRYVFIREAAKNLAYAINKNGGIESEKEKSILKLRECIFYAIASIVLPTS